jgi:uncharacterized membrane protein YeaQ/YmgE (transglycosylase-associated protein family)
MPSDLDLTAEQPIGKLEISEHSYRQAQPETKNLDLAAKEKPSQDKPTISDTSYNPAEDREKARGWIAFALIGLLGAALGLSFFGAWHKAIDSETLMKLMGLVFTPLVALVGSAVGFYFGGQLKGDGH